MKKFPFKEREEAKAMGLCIEKAWIAQCDCCQKIFKDTLSQSLFSSKRKLIASLRYCDWSYNKDKEKGFITCIECKERGGKERGD